MTDTRRLDPLLVMLHQRGALTWSSRSLPTDTPLERPLQHALSPHAPLWMYIDPAVLQAFQPPMYDRPPYGEVAPDSSLEELAQATSLFVCIGADPTPELERLCADPDIACIVFEPDQDRFRASLRTRAMENLLAPGNHFVVGDPDAVGMTLYDLLLAAPYQKGMPLTLLQGEAVLEHKKIVRRFVTIMEAQFYSQVIYPVHGQAHARGYPLRPMERGLFYDQVVHMYQNLARAPFSGRLLDLRNCCSGATALCVAAGPALDVKIDYIRSQQHKTVVIAVNNALRSLEKHGIQPDFAVINDTSLDAEKSFAGLERQEGVKLVAHLLACGGGNVFNERYFFGDILQPLLGKLGALKLYGSVITTAFSLAEYMGCVRAVLVGAQMGGLDPYEFSYAKDSMHGERGASTLPLMYRYPQFAPAVSAAGDFMYSTPNFIDAALWLVNRIEKSSLEVVNTSRQSLIHGKNIRIDPDYDAPQQGDKQAMLSSIRPRSSVNRGRVQEFCRNEAARWESVAQASQGVLDTQDRELMLAKARQLVQVFDKQSVSYLVQRYKDFSNPDFHAGFFDSDDPAINHKASVHYFSYVQEMAEELRTLALQAAGQHAQEPWAPDTPT